MLPRDWGGKIAEHVMRIVALLTMADRVMQPYPWEDPIGVAEVERGIILSDYLIDQGIVCYQHMGSSPGMSDAKYILNWIMRKIPPGDGTVETFTYRDAHRGMRRRFERPFDMDSGLSILCERSFLKELPIPKKPEGSRGPKFGRWFAISPFCRNIAKNVVT
jgi:hypothetical protein